MKNTLRVVAATFYIAVIALLLLPGVVAAEGLSYSLFPVSAETGEDLGRLVYTLGPGETATDAVAVVNNSDSPLRLAMFASAATTASGGGTAFPETATPGSWVSLSVPELSLEAKGSGQFLFTITVPEGASSGDYLSGLVVQEAGQADKQEERVVIFSIVQRQALTVHVIVPGPKFASLEVASIKQVWDGAAVGFDVELHNTGNVRVKAKGTLEVTDESGKVIGSFPIELGPILAGDTLVHHVSSGAALPPGQYGASVQMSFTPVRLAPSQKGAVPVTLEPVAVDEAAVTTGSNFEITPEVVKAVVEQAKARGFDIEGIVIREGEGRGLWLYVAGGLGVVTFTLLLAIVAWLRFSPLRSLIRVRRLEPAIAHGEASMAQYSAEPAAAMAGAEGAVAQSMTANATRKVLLVDDEERVLALLSAILGRDERNQVLLARDGEEALEIARREKPDLIFLDIVMPRMDGYEVALALKSDPATAHIKVVMVTALTQEQDRRRALEVGAEGFFAKPFSVEEILAEADKIVAGR